MLRVAVVDDDAQDRAKISAGLDFVAAQKGCILQYQRI